MTKIDRYLVGLYFRVFLICFLSLSGLLVIVHFFTSLDEFIEYGKKVGGLPNAVVSYYGPYLLSMFNQMAGLMALMATMFVIAWLYRTNELTAILAAGVSKGRVVRPLLFASCLVFVLTLINREFVVPRFADSLDKSPQDLAGEGTRQLRPTYDIDFGVLIGGRHLLPATSEIQDAIFRMEGPGAAFSQQLTAHAAEFVTGNGSHPQGYLLKGVRSPTELMTRDSIVVSNRVFVLSPKDNPWLAPDQCFVGSNLQYEMLNGKNDWTSYAGISTIVSKLRMDPRYYGNAVRVSLHSKVVQPITDFTLLLFGIPIVLSRPDRHLFWVAGASLAVITCFSIVVLGFHFLGNAHDLLKPSMAAWAPLLICTPIAWSRASSSMQS